MNTLIHITIIVAIPVLIYGIITTMKQINLKFIKSPFKFLFVIICLRKSKYRAFRQISFGKHFYNWQWSLLDKFYKYK